MYFFLAELFAISWLFFFGAAIGSFLNVVIYRLPRGETLFGRSKCPYCHDDIAAYDNVPVLAWLHLRGKCRTCQLNIDLRYPLVEFLIGAIFLLVGMAVVGTGGATIPGIESPRYSGLAWQLLEPRDELILMFVLQSLVLTGLLAISLIRVDTQVVPMSVPGFVFVGCLLTGICAPDINSTTGAELGDLGSGLATNMPLLGAMLGLLYGFVLQQAIVATNREVVPFRVSSVILWGAAGWAVGAQAIVSISLVACLAFVAGRIYPTRERRIFDTSEGVLFVSWLFNIATWFLLATIPGWPSPDRAWYFPAIWFSGSVALLTLVTWRSYQD